LVLLVKVTGLQAQQSAGTEKAVTALEQQWLQVEKTSNAELLAPLLADNLVSTSAAGKVTGKSETLADLKTEKWTNADDSDVRVRVYGHTAVATEAFKGNGTDASGKSLDEHVRWTDTWVKMPERQVAMCCQSRLGSKNVSSQTTSNRCGRLIDGRLFYLACYVPVIWREGTQLASITPHRHRRDRRDRRDHRR
jgi:hypothetical protein